MGISNPRQTDTNSAVVLALDIGTSSTRTLLFDAAGRSVPGSECQIALDLIATPDGGAELDTAALFETVLRTVDASVATAIQPIVAVGIACFWHSLLGLDGAGRPVTPVYLWADTRSRDAVDAIKADFDPTELWQRTGCFVHSSYWPGKLRWLRESDPGVFGQVREWVAFSDYLLRRLVGFRGTSVSMASSTAMMN